MSKSGEIIWSKIVLGTCHYCGFSFMLTANATTTECYKDERAKYDLRLDEHLLKCRSKYQVKINKGVM